MCNVGQTAQSMSIRRRVESGCEGGDARDEVVVQDVSMRVRIRKGSYTITAPAPFIRFHRFSVCVSFAPSTQ